MNRTKSAAPRALALMALVGLSLFPPGAAGQQVKGFVSYTHNNFPVALATVRLLTVDGRVVVTGESGFDGSFLLKAPRPGDYLVHVEHLTAYDMVDGPIRLDSAGVAVVAFQVVPRAYALEEITVEVERRSLPLARSGYYDRERMGLGHFVGPEDLERRPAIFTTDLLRMMPGVRVLTQNGIAGGISRYPVMSYAMRSNLVGGMCYPRVYVNGAVMERGGSTPPFSSFDNLVSPSELGAMEVYSSPAEMPAQYAGLTACGVILIWTKQGR